MPWFLAMKSMVQLSVLLMVSVPAFMRSASIARWFRRPFSPLKLDPGLPAFSRRCLR